MDHQPGRSGDVVIFVGLSSTRRMPGGRVGVDLVNLLASWLPASVTAAARIAGYSVQRFFTRVLSW